MQPKITATNIVKSQTFRLAILLCVFLGRVSITFASPYSIEKLPDKTVYNDFVVGPGKYEVSLKPGESKVINLIVTNRLGKDKSFQIQTEDFKGSRDLEKTVVLLDDQSSPYSLKNYLTFASTTFTLGNAERATIPVTVRVPTDASPGGLYGSVVIGTVTTPEEQVLSGESSAGVSPIITRIGSLIFIRVAGDIVEDLTLKDFSLRNNRWLLGGTPVNFEILYENNGTVHENPYGAINITNIFGSDVGHIDVEPWFILPDSLRAREITWNPKFLLGRYKATLDLSRVYDNKKDSATVYFWVIPWKLITIAFAALTIIVLLFRWLASKIKISIK